MPTRTLRVVTLTASAVLAAVLADAPPAASGSQDGALAAAATGPPSYSIPRSPGDIKIDGRLDDEAWNNALVLDLPYEIEPGENTPAPVATECLLLYDKDRFYVGFRAHDPEPRKIRAHLTDRDQCFRDDFVGVMIDPFNDERRGFEFFVNPLGVQMDLSRNEVGSGNNEDSAWDALWDSAGRITGKGYEVEIAIPFSSLRFPSTRGEMTWGIYPFRSYPRTNRHQLASVKNDRNLPGLFVQAPKVRGFEGAKSGHSLEITPTLTGSRTDQRPDFPTGPLEEGEIEVEPGLSMQWGVTPNVALNATANPDFSQVEADAAQLDVNRQFTLFYPEKRPFFLEGADFFQTPMRAVYTRSIADPDFGLKLTGKQGKSALGTFVARDAVTNVLLPSSQSSTVEQIDGSVWDAVLRYRRDVSTSSTIGLLFTGREGEDYQNFVYGIDGLLRVTKVDSIRFQLLDTHTRYPDAFALANDQKQGPFSGLGGQLYYEHSSRDWNWWGGYTSKSRDFRADLGFIAQTDIRGPFAGFQKVINPVKPTWYTRLGFGIEGDHAEQQSGELQAQFLKLTWDYRGPYQSMWFGNVGPARERFEGVTYDLINSFFFFNIRPTGDFTSSLEFNFGDQVDHDNARKGRVLNLTPGLTFDPGRHVRLQLDYTFEQLDAEGDRVYTANLAQLKAIYQFNTRMFVRAIFQFTDIQRNVSNYDDPSTEPLERELFTQLLFSYKLSPQSLFHIGYSDTQIGAESLDLTRAERTLFCKLSYAWRP